MVTVFGQRVLRRGVVTRQTLDFRRKSEVRKKFVVMSTDGLPLLLGLNVLAALGTRIRVRATPEIILVNPIL